MTEIPNSINFKEITIGYSKKFTVKITSKMLEDFATLSGDYNPLHVDAISARRFLFGSPVVHGIHTILWSLNSWLENETDIIKALFPGGSITGAPKEQSMKIIDSLENYQRGIYTGALGSVFSNGDMDFSICIRNTYIIIEIFYKFVYCRRINQRFVSLNVYNNITIDFFCNFCHPICSG